MEEVEVIVVGAGPTGLMLACELALAGVGVRVLERRAGVSNVTRAFAVHARTLELLDARGLADELLRHGTGILSVAPLGTGTLDLTELDSRFARLQLVPQSGTEQVLAARAKELGVEVIEASTVAGLSQDDGGVDLEVTGPDGVRQERASYVVGCDGAHSRVRELAGIEFVGAEYATHILLADVTVPDAPVELVGKANEYGAAILVPFGDDLWRAIAWDRTREDLPLDVPVTGAEMRESFRRIAGTDYGMTEPTWTSRFLSERRQAASYRSGRVFLAGDAAHVHSPMGGQGMNVGIQDAFNLGWKLAAALQGRAAPWLLDSYQAERHPVGAEVLKLTDAFNRMILGRSRIGRWARASAVAVALRIPPVRAAVAGRLSGIGIAYPARTNGHPWVGRRMPDLELSEGRLYEKLRDGRFLMVDNGQWSGITEPWADRVTPVAASGRGVPGLVLVRPDGYVAWAREGDDATAIEVASALTEWLGRPATVAS